MKHPYFTVFIHRLYDNGNPKHGGLDILLKGLVARGSAINMVEFPLESSKFGYFKTSYFSSTQEYNPKQYKFIQTFAPLVYLQEFIFSIIWAVACPHRGDVIITSDPLTSLFGLFLRKIGFYKFHYFHCIDYSPNRFKSKIASKVYKFILEFTLKNADLVGSVTLRAYKLLEKIGPKKLLYVPNSPSMSEYSKYFVPLERRVKNKIVVTVAGVSDKYRIIETIEMVRAVAKRVPDVALYVIGSLSFDKEYADMVETYIIDHKLENLVTLTGQLNKSDNVNMLRDAQIGLAYYNGSHLHVNYGDSLKIREYAALGLAIISDGVTPTSIEMRDLGAGVVQDDYSLVPSEIEKLLTDPVHYSNLCKTALQWAEDMDKDRILDNLLENFNSNAANF